MTSVLASVSASSNSLEYINPVDSFVISSVFDIRENDLDFVDSLSYDSKVFLFGSLIDQILSSGPEINSSIFGLISFDHDVMDDNCIMNDTILHRINSITGLTRLRGGIVKEYNDIKVQNLFDNKSFSFDWLGNIVEYCCVLENITAYISQELNDVEFDFNVYSMCGFTLLNKNSGKFHDFMLTLKPFNNRWIPTGLVLSEILDTLY